MLTQTVLAVALLESLILNRSDQLRVPKVLLRTEPMTKSHLTPDVITTGGYARRVLGDSLS